MNGEYLPRLLPGTFAADVRKEFWQQEVDIQNVQGGGHPALARYLKYMEWTNLATRRLRSFVSESDVERLVHTRMFWTLQAHAATPELKVVTDLVDVEIADRVQAFRNAKESMDCWEKRWLFAGAIAMPDTSFFIHCPEKIAEWDLAPNLGVREEPIVVLIPMAVVDELDRLKESKDRDVRWRAGHSLGVIDRVVALGAASGVLKEGKPVPAGGEGPPRGAVALDILYDPPGHVRLPIDDDEIVDRGVVAQGLAGQTVTLLTFDTGQSMRARRAGLRAVRSKRPGEDQAETEPK